MSHNKGWTIGFSVVGAISLAIISVVVVAVTQNAEARARVVAEAAERAAGASAVVQGYMDAVAAGDADAAWGFVDSVASKRSDLMTNEALSAAIEKTPITDIVVAEVPVEEAFGMVDVKVTYSIGGEAQEAEVGVSGPWDATDDKDWTIYSPLTADLDLSDSVLAAAPTVNGIAVTEASLSVFPGTYTLAIEDARLKLGGATEVLATQSSGSGTFDPELTISDETQAEFARLVKADVNKCLQSKNLNGGCGLELPSQIGATTLFDGTIARSLPAETQAALDSMKGTSDFSNPLQVSGGLLGYVDAVAGCSAGGQTGTCEITPGSDHELKNPTIDFGAENPKVLWD